MPSWEYFHKLFLKFIFQKPVSLEQVFLSCLLNQDTREIVVRHQQKCITSTLVFYLLLFKLTETQNSAPQKAPRVVRQIIDTTI